MKFISTPLVFLDQGIRIRRDLEERVRMLDNLVELIVFTPRGQFDADPDFGFEYWNHEFSNVHYREYPDAGHNVWTRTYRDDEVLKWFFSQRRAAK